MPITEYLRRPLFQGNENKLELRDVFRNIRITKQATNEMALDGWRIVNPGTNKREIIRMLVNCTYEITNKRFLSNIST